MCNENKKNGIYTIVFEYSVVFYVIVVIEEKKCDNECCSAYLLEAFCPLLSVISFFFLF